MPGIPLLARVLVAVTVMAALVATALTGTGFRGLDHSAPAASALTEGIAEDSCGSQQVIVVPPDQNVSYDGDESVRLAGRCAAGVSAGSRAGAQWLAAGTVPGRGPVLRSMADRALLDLYLSVQPDGAVVAGYYHGWDYAWPRDSSWVAVALASTGHGDDALRVLRFLGAEQNRNGTWAARYQTNGSGPVQDGRPTELDAVGWVPWAVWSWYQSAGGGPAGRGELAALWPMVNAAAGAAERSLTPDGLPGPATDYWEHGAQVTLGTAAPLLTGLRAAADIAAALGRTTASQRWGAAASRLGTAVQASFGCYGDHRLPRDPAGPDAAVTWLGPPFGPASAALVRAEQTAQRALTLPGGGLLPGTDWPGNPSTAWTPETAFFALADAETGQQAAAATLLDWLAAHRTVLGELPEQVDANGHPGSVAPLAWTDAAVLLTMVAQSHPLPAVPVPGQGKGTAAGGCPLPPLTVVGR
ncbi:MAG: glycoside hydrolase family 15 [Actinobacteria bacterium]|nr:glycoside hydrolase family 15 [Actinomycetota bacterium]